MELNITSNEKEDETETSIHEKEAYDNNDLRLENITPDKDIMEYDRITPDKELELDRITPDKEIELDRITPDKELELERITPDKEIELERITPDKEILELEKITPDREIIEYEKITPDKEISGFKSISADREISGCERITPDKDIDVFDKISPEKDYDDTIADENSQHYSTEVSDLNTNITDKDCSELETIRSSPNNCELERITPDKNGGEMSVITYTQTPEANDDTVSQGSGSNLDGNTSSKQLKSEDEENKEKANADILDSKLQTEDTRIPKNAAGKGTSSKVVDKNFNNEDEQTSPTQESALHIFKDFLVIDNYEPKKSKHFKNKVKENNNASTIESKKKNNPPQDKNSQHLTKSFTPEPAKRRDPNKTKRDIEKDKFNKTTLDIVKKLETGLVPPGMESEISSHNNLSVVMEPPWVDDPHTRIHPYKKMKFDDRSSDNAHYDNHPGGFHRKDLISSDHYHRESSSSIVGKTPSPGNDRYINRSSPSYKQRERKPYNIPLRRKNSRSPMRRKPTRTPEKRTKSPSKQSKSPQRNKPSVRRKSPEIKKSIRRRSRSPRRRSPNYSRNRGRNYRDRCLDLISDKRSPQRDEKRQRSTERFLKALIECSGVNNAEPYPNTSIMPPSVMMPPFPSNLPNVGMFPSGPPVYATPPPNNTNFFPRMPNPPFPQSFPPFNPPINNFTTSPMPVPPPVEISSELLVPIKPADEGIPFKIKLPSLKPENQIKLAKIPNANKERIIKRCELAVQKLEFLHFPNSLVSMPDRNCPILDRDCKPSPIRKIMPPTYNFTSKCNNTGNTLLNAIASTLDMAKSLMLRKSVDSINVLGYNFKEATTQTENFECDSCIMRKFKVDKDVQTLTNIVIKRSVQTQVADEDMTSSIATFIPNQPISSSPKEEIVSLMHMTPAQILIAELTAKAKSLQRSTVEVLKAKKSSESKMISTNAASQSLHSYYGRDSGDYQNVNESNYAPPTGSGKYDDKYNRNEQYEGNRSYNRNPYGRNEYGGSSDSRSAGLGRSNQNNPSNQRYPDNSSFQHDDNDHRSSSNMRKQYNDFLRNIHK